VRLRPAVFRLGRRGVLNWHEVLELTGCTSRVFLPLRVGVAGQGNVRGVFSSIKYFIIIIIITGLAIFEPGLASNRAQDSCDCV
jgi:hypothetical protein